MRGLNRLISDLTIRGLRVQIINGSFEINSLVCIDTTNAILAHSYFIVSHIQGTFADIVRTMANII